MAKAAKVFVLQNGPGTTTYTVPTGKYVVFNFYSGTNTTASALLINTVEIVFGGGFGGGAMSDFKGMVAPAGTTIAAKVTTSGTAMISGFEYDV